MVQGFQKMPLQTKRHSTLLDLARLADSRYIRKAERAREANQP